MSRSTIRTLIVIIIILFTIAAIKWNSYLHLSSALVWLYVLIKKS